MRQCTVVIAALSCWPRIVIYGHFVRERPCWESEYRRSGRQHIFPWAIAKAQYIKGGKEAELLAIQAFEAYLCGQYLYCWYPVLGECALVQENAIRTSTGVILLSIVHCEEVLILVIPQHYNGFLCIIPKSTCTWILMLFGHSTWQFKKSPDTFNQNRR